jgi:hypothetical protein
MIVRDRIEARRHPKRATSRTPCGTTALLLPHGHLALGLSITTVGGLEWDLRAGTRGDWSTVIGKRAKEREWRVRSERQDRGTTTS